MAHQDRRVVVTQEPKPSGLGIGETLIQGGRPIVEYRRWREALIEAARQAVSASATSDRHEAQQTRFSQGVHTMKIAKLVALLGLLTMTSILIYGFAVGDFSGEGKQLLSMPWGIVSLVDLYVGFILFSGWIVHRERSLVRSVVWVFLMMVLGFFTASLYTLIALQTSGGDWQRFWMGRRQDRARA